MEHNCPTCGQKVEGKKLFGKVIALDSGHGWNIGKAYDVGAVGNAAQEVNLNLNVVLLVAEALKAQGATVHIFQYTEPNSPRLFLAGKGARAGQVKADVFVSIHHNAFDGSVQGCETLVDNFATPEDRRLARAIQNEIVGELKFNDRGIKERSLGVLRGCPTHIPACLVEGFFIDWQGFGGSIDTTYIGKYARGVAAGITAYLTK
ncbi:MAG: N-acetylmuramoyl-L-alanine amidase family protein [Ilumatobacteraceae bacterium]